MKLQAQVINEKKSGKSPVYVICYLSGKRCRFKTGVEVTADEWNEKKGIVINRSKDAKEKNLLINNVIKRLTEIEIKYRLQYKTLTADALVHEYETPTYDISFLDFYEKEMKKRKGLLAAGTYEKHNITLKKLRQFRNEILFCDLDIDVLNDYKVYCKNELGNCMNTINTNLKNIKFYVRLAYKKKIIHFNLFDDFKISNIVPDRNYLTEAELTKIMKHYNNRFTSETDKKVLRPFLFACFTSLRHSDVEALKFDNIVNDTIVIQPIKTSYICKTVKIPLCTPALNLIDFSRNTRHVFSMFCSQFTNRRLKEICELLGIRKTITFHCARHTFATMYLRNTNDIPGLQKILGHASINETMIYTHILDDDIQCNITKLNSIAI